MKTVKYIVAGGRRIPCAVPVVPWTEHGMSFPGLRPRKRTDLVVTHWTGAENPAATMFGSLRRKGFSVHFFIGAAGDVWQFNDCDAFAAHAKGMNDRSVGIEIQNRADGVADRHGIKRALAKEVIHGREFVYTMFTPEQVHSALSVVASVCEAYGLPMQVPMEPVKRAKKADEIKADGSAQHIMRVIPRQLTDAEFKSFRGVVGHFHKTDVSKQDAGLALLRAVAALEPRAALGPDGGQQ